MEILDHGKEMSKIKQRSADEMLELILSVAKEDQRIRAVWMSGSRANPDVPKDEFQDFDVVFQVRDVTPYWDNDGWIEKCFGRPALMQKPESMEMIPPDGDGNFVYLMLFPDGNRVDLCITTAPFVESDEPAILLLNKEKEEAGGGNDVMPKVTGTKAYWYVKRPTQKHFSDCCNEFYWCLNNVAKGIARDELSYAMKQFNDYVRDMLVQMLKWYVGVENDFSASAGKEGKFFKKYLPPELYERLRRTYSDAEYERLWKAVFEMIGLFDMAARHVAGKLGFSYKAEEREAIEAYIARVRQE